jgi:hypothetical protein
MREERSQQIRNNQSCEQQKPGAAIPLGF